MFNILLASSFHRAEARTATWTSLLREYDFFFASEAVGRKSPTFATFLLLKK